MIVQRAQVYQLEQHMYLRDANRKTWRVVATRPATGNASEIMMVDQDQVAARVTLPLAKEIDILVPSEAEAVAVIKAALGPVTILTFPDFDVTKNTKAKRLLISTHLAQLHKVSIIPGRDAENGSITELAARHNLVHAVPFKDVRIPHIHLPESTIRYNNARRGPMNPDAPHPYLGKAWSRQYLETDLSPLGGAR